MRTIVLAALAIGLAGAAPATQTRTVTGQAGVLAEWDVTATVTEQAAGRWSGPLRMRHMGFCSAEGPEEKIGELRMRVSDPPAQIAAALSIDGVVCTFVGRLKDGYNGSMRCPDRPDVPMMLILQ